MTMQRIQEVGFGESHNYRQGSPHLRHWHLYDRLVELLRDAIDDVAVAGLPLTVLEVGAGHGGYTEPALAHGCSVTATEMSRPSIDRLDKKFHLNRNFSSYFDSDGSLSILGDRKYSLILCSSVLHHIPDYVGFIDKACRDHLNPGGTFLSVQDPLWYPDLDRVTYYLTKTSYFVWRLAQGKYLNGVQTRIRRLRREYDESNPADMVEYHVVRSGVNHRDIATLMIPQFESVELTRYWSCIDPAWQRIGELCKRTNTFTLRAKGYRGMEYWPSVAGA